MHKVLSVIGVISRENAKLASYQLREISQVWYTLWKNNRMVESGPIEWKECKRGFSSKVLSP